MKNLCIELLVLVAPGMKRTLYSIMFLLTFCMLPFHVMADTLLEAEDADYATCNLITGSKYSGGKALEMTAQEARITFTFNAEKNGKYVVYVGYDGLYGDKTVNITVNGNQNSFQVSGFGESAVGTFIMNKGNNTIVITPSWTWYRIDYIRIENAPDALPFDISRSPVDADATPAAKQMYAFLYDCFGKKTISGIMTGDMSSDNGNVTQHADVKAVYNASGKTPALIGFDFMNATGKTASNSYNKSYTQSSVNLARDTYRRGGLPAFTWHWRDPSRSTNAFYSADCSIKVTNAMNADGSWNTSSTLYRNIINDINVIADYFLSLQNDGVACIFRPLHEASGKWFWWGREGAVPFVKLYRLMYDQMVNVKGVHNLIWVWNAGSNDYDWDPGEEYYDIVSADIYNNAYDYSSNYAYFDNLKTLTQGRKIIALSENGPIPDIDKEFDEDAVWSWWMPWYNTWGGNFVAQTSNEEWSKCMNDDRVITLEDLATGWDVNTSVTSPVITNDQDQAIYDLQGRRLNRVPSRGFYIKGKKKYFVY